MEESGVVWNLQDLNEIQQDFDVGVNEEIYKQIFIRESIKIKQEQEAQIKKRGKMVKSYKTMQKYEKPSNKK